MRIHQENKIDEYGIFEVYYKEGNVNGWTQEAVRVYTDNLDEIKKTLQYMQEALNKPILDYKTGKEI